MGLSSTAKTKYTIYTYILYRSIEDTVDSYSFSATFYLLHRDLYLNWVEGEVK